MVQVVYGLTHPIETWDPVWTQLHHVVHVFRTAWTTPGLWNKVCVFIKGPGWAPGKPRLGLIEDVPPVTHPWPKYDSSVPFFLSLYILVHFGLVLVSFSIVDRTYASTSGSLMAPGIFLVLCLYAILSLTSFGALFDRRPYAVGLEIARLLLYIGAETVFWSIYEDDFLFLWQHRASAPSSWLQLDWSLKLVRTYFVLSLFWIFLRWMMYPSRAAFYAGRSRSVADDVDKGKAPVGPVAAEPQTAPDAASGIRDRRVRRRHGDGTAMVSASASPASWRP